MIMSMIILMIMTMTMGMSVEVELPSGRFVHVLGTCLLLFFSCHPEIIPILPY